MFLAYKTDTWHTHESKVLIGVTIEHDIAIQICGLKADEECALFRQVERQHLIDMNQTQDYPGEGEFVIEEIEIDTLL